MFLIGIDNSLIVHFSFWTNHFYIKANKGEAMI